MLIDPAPTLHRTVAAKAPLAHVLTAQRARFLAPSAVETKTDGETIMSGHKAAKVINNRMGCHASLC
jgi:hypothetical protein